MSFTLFQKRLSCFSASLTLITAVGFILRVLAARGELWLDEIWSLMLLKDLSAAHEIFWNISNANNHFLNSLWLWITGPDAPEVWQRFASILLGTATIPAAALFIRRQAGEAAGLATAVIFAFGYIFVLYGSEARGYAGLILMIVLSADAADRLIEAPQSTAPAVQFALFVALGGLFHLIMIPAIGVIGAGAAILLARDLEGWRDHLATLLRLMIAALLGLLPVTLCFFVGVSLRPYGAGSLALFSYPDLAEGLAGMARTTLGLPAVLSDLPTLLLAAPLAAGALILCPARLRAPALVAIFVLPLLEMGFKAPNLSYARYHLPIACFLALAGGAGVGVLWMRGGWRRGLALALGAAGLMGHGVLVAEILTFGRGDCAGAVAEMATAGPARYASDLPTETSWLVAYHLRRSARNDLVLTATAGDCDLPDWRIAANWPGASPAPRDRDLFGPAACPQTFVRVAHYPSARLSGLEWTLYRRLPPGSPTLDAPLISR